MNKISKYVAVKVGTGNADRTNHEVLTQLTQSKPDNQGSEAKLQLFPTILDHFDLVGPNGTYPCLVTPPARCSLFATKDESGLEIFQLDVARSLVAQLVSAVALVHSRGYAHGGNTFSSSELSITNQLTLILYTFTWAIFSCNHRHFSTTYQ